MIIIWTTPDAAPATAQALGDEVRPGQRLWLSSSVDVRAARAACSIAGNSKAMAVNIGGFAVGFFTGIAACILWIVLFHLAKDYGQSLVSRTNAAEQMAPTAFPASDEPSQ